MTLSCYRCGESLADLSLPLRRLDECPACRAELHVCLMCCNYDAALPTGCTEDDAIEVRNKKSANFCDYFTPSEHAFKGGDMAADQAARAALSALFDEPARGKEPQSSNKTPDQEALERAKRLFGDE